AGAAALAALLFAHIPFDNADAARATNYLSIAVAMSKDPQHASQAPRFYQLALDAAPEFPAARMGVGLSLARQKRFQEAIPHLQGALKLWPNYAEAHYNLGVAFAGTERPQEAAQEFVETLRLTPGDADAHFALGRTLTQLGKPKEAVEQYLRGL